MKRLVRNVTANLDGTFSVQEYEEDVPVPKEITNFQARAALMAAGLFELVDNAVKQEQGIAFQVWEYANTISRQGSLVNSIASQLGLTSQQLDNLFIEAEKIEA